MASPHLKLLNSHAIWKSAILGFPPIYSSVMYSTREAYFEDILFNYADYKWKQFNDFLKWPPDFPHINWCVVILWPPQPFFLHSFPAVYQILMKAYRCTKIWIPGCSLGAQWRLLWTVLWKFLQSTFNFALHSSDLCGLEPSVTSDMIMLQLNHVPDQYPSVFISKNIAYDGRDCIPLWKKVQFSYLSEHKCV